MNKLKRTFSAMLAFLLMMSCLGMNQFAHAAEKAPGNPDDVTLYPQTPNAEQASDYTMTINGKEVFIEDFYKASQARVIHNGQGPLDVTVTVKNPGVKLTTCDVYPRRADVYPVVDKEAKTVNFTITPEMLEDNYQYIISIAGLENIILMVDAPETDVPDPDSQNVLNVMDVEGVKNDGTKCTEAIQKAIDQVGEDPELDILYFPDGRYVTGRLEIRHDDVAIYLSSGTLIEGASDAATPEELAKDYPFGETGYGHNDRRNGSVFIQPMGKRELVGDGENGHYEVTPIKNFKLYGRGVIDGKGREIYSKVGSGNDNQANWIHLFEAKDVDGLIVKDVILRNSSNWCFKLENVNNAEVTNLKAINSTDQRYADGMDMSSVTHAKYNNCMSYSQDDALAIMTLQLKNETNTGYDGPPQGPTEDLTFTNHFGYTDCSAVRIGWDSTDIISDLLFDNCEWVKYDAGGFNIHRLQYDNKYGPITFRNCRWDNADNTGMKTFATCYGTDGNGFSQGRINAEEIKFENCIIDGLYQGAFNIQGQTIDKVIFDSTRISNGTASGLVTNQNEIPNLATTGAAFEFTDTYGIAENAKENRYQAETMPLSGGADLSTNTQGYDGFGFVRNLNTADAAVKFTIDSPAEGAYDLGMLYSSDTTLNNLAMYVNGVKIKNLYLESTEGSWEDHVETVSLKEGKNIVELKAAFTEDESIRLDYIDTAENDPDTEIPPQEVVLNDNLEAEAAETKTNVEVISDGTASQTKAVLFDAKDDSIEYGALQEDADRMVIRYKSEQDTSIDIYSGKEKLTSASLNATGDGWSETTVSASFAKDNTIRLEKALNDAEVTVDYIRLEAGTPNLINVALRKDASTNAPVQNIQWYGPRFAVDGATNDSYKFQTSGSPGTEKPQELLIDLEQQADIYEILLYNNGYKNMKLEVYAGNDPEDLTKVADAKDYTINSDHNPAEVIFNEDVIPFNARFVKISCVGGNSLELNEVEIMGVPTGDPAGVPGIVSQFKPVTWSRNMVSRDDGKHGYSALNDWEDSGQWYGSGRGPDNPLVVEYDLQRDYTLTGFINTIPIFNYPMKATLKVEVCPDGAKDNWTTVYGEKETNFEKSVEDTGAYYLPSKPIQFDRTGVGRYVRITITSTGVFYSNELSILGSVVLPRSVTIDEGEEITMLKGGEQQLTATLIPAEATSKGVVWSSSDRTVATVDSTGEVTGIDNGTAVITVRSKDGSLKDSITVTVAETITAKDIVSVEPQEPITVMEGTKAEDLQLPKTVTVTLEDDSARDLKVTWDTSSYKGEPGRTYDLSGALTLPADVANPEGLKAAVQVKVEKMPEKAITEVSSPEDFTVAPGTAFEDLKLPEQVEVTLDDGSKINVNVAWDSSAYDSTAGAVNELNGELQAGVQDGYKVTNPEELQAEVTVTVKDVENLSLTSEFTVLNGYTQWGNDSSIGVLKAYDDKLNTEMILGYHPDHPDDWKASPENPHRILIELQENSKIEDIITYRSDANNYTMDVSVGMSPDTLEKISTQKTYKGSNGANTPVSVILDDGKAYPDEVKYVQLEITGTGDNSTKFSEVQVMGKRLTAQADAIVSVNPVSDITVPAGTAADQLNLPKKVLVTLASGMNTLLDIEWDVSGYLGEPGQTYTLTGAFTLPEGISNPDNLAPTVKVIVEKIPQYQVTVEGGTGSGAYEEGATVTIKADTPEEGMKFDKWVSEDVEFEDAAGMETTFVMPAKDVTVTATYKALPDKSALKEAIDTAEKIDLDGYTTESGNALTEALKEAKAVYDNADAAETEIQEAADALNAALKGLVKLGDKTELQAKLKEAAEIKENLSDYLTEGQEEFLKAYDAAAAVNEDPEASETEVAEALENLTAAIDGLTLKPLPDKSALKAAIEEAEKISLDDYTTESGNALSEALEAAKTVYDNEDATEAEIAEAIDNLNTAVKRLVKLGDKTELQEKLKEAAEVKENLSGYLTEGREAFLKAYDAAEKVNADQEASETDVTDALKKLTDAMDGLTLKPDKSELTDLVEKAKGIDTDKYTDETVKGFMESLSIAEDVLADEEATETEVSEAVARLANAIEQLEEKDTGNPDDGNKPGDGNKPDDGNNPDDGNKPGSGNKPGGGNKPNDGNKPNSGNNSNAGNTSGSGSDGGNKAVQTGDTSNIFGVLAVMMISASAAVGILHKKKKD